MKTYSVASARRATFLWVFVAAALSAVGLAEAQSSSQPPDSGPGVDATAARGDADGIDDIDLALRDICEVVTCYWMRSDGEGDVNDDVSAVVASYEVNGVDPNATQEERSNAQIAIDDCGEWLVQNPDILDPIIEADFVEMLVQLSDDLQQ